MNKLALFFTSVLFALSLFFSFTALDKVPSSVEMNMQGKPWIIGVIALLVLLLVLFLKRRMRVGLLIFYVGVILYFTLFNREQGDRSSNLEIFWSYKQFFTSPELGIQIIDNIWLFFPLGALLCSLKRDWKLLFVAIGLTVFIESTQYILGLGLCELDDIIGNSFGAWLGWECYCAGIKWRKQNCSSNCVARKFSS